MFEVVNIVKFAKTTHCIMNILTRVARFYLDGFRGMTVGRQLWALIIIKVLILFGILKIFFFPDVLGNATPEGSSKGETAKAIILSRK